MPKKKHFPSDAIQHSVQVFPEADAGIGPRNIFTLQLASAADEVTPWGGSVALRDRQLRTFWPTETNLAGAISTICERNAVYTYELEGPGRMTDGVRFVLENAIAGQERGWMPFINAWSQDLYTCDNGAFIELIRAEFTPASPVIGIAHLDSAECIRTGDPYYPVIYKDTDGVQHKMPYWSVIATTELPTPIRSMNGVGHCAVTRVLRAAQIFRDYAIFKHEKISGRFTRVIHFVGGVNKAEIKDVENREQAEADNHGLTRYVAPLIIASLDPEKPVTHVQVDMAALPDGFDLDKELKWYITELALNIGEDYQTLAPLPGGNLGTSTQSEILHRKSRSKGPAYFMESITRLFRLYGVVPPSVQFEFAEQDAGAELQKAQLAEIRARTRALRIQSGELSIEAARQLAIESDDLEEEHLPLIEHGTVVTQPSNENIENPDQTAADRPASEEGGPKKRGKPSLFRRVFGGNT